MKVLKDMINGNLYLVGACKGKEYLFNGICKFEITENRKERLQEIKLNEYCVNKILEKIKNQYLYDYNNICFVKE